MSKILFYVNVDEIDNTDTLYEDVITVLYDEALWQTMLLNINYLRSSILSMINAFIEHEGTIFIKEFAENPPMIYDDPEKFEMGKNEIATDFIIVRHAYDLETVNTNHNKIDAKYSLVLDALNPGNVTTSSWDSYLDALFLYYSGEGVLKPRVQKIMLENVINALEFWNNLDNILIQTMLEEYNATYDVVYNEDTAWQEPLYLISKKYWKKFSFVLTINDYDLYDETKKPYLDLIAEKYFNNGYFDEIVIKMNYFYWFDDFQKIVTWSEQNLTSALVSYRFNTLFSNNIRNRYFNESEATLYGDVQRKNSNDEELQMFKERLPIFCDKILTNPQTYGFELEGGYFGKEGNVPNISLNSENWEFYKDILCSTLSMSPFAEFNDLAMVVFPQPKKTVFVCVKGE